MENGVVVELVRGSTNWTKVVEDIVKLDGELRKRNAGLLYVSAVGETVGNAIYSWPASLSASITKFAVKENCRRQGHGEALLRAAIEKCRGRKVQRVSLHVDPTRTAAVNLYKKLGFQVDCLVKTRRIEMLTECTFEGRFGSTLHRIFKKFPN